MAAAVLTTNLGQADKVHLGGGKYLITGTITSDTGDYATGGLAVTAATFALDRLDTLFVATSSIISTRPYFDKANLKIKVFKEDGISGIEVEHAASALSAQVWPYIAIGFKAE